jgi:hypothetical protein
MGSVFWSHFPSRQAIPLGLKMLHPENHFSFASGTLQQVFSIFAVKAKANQRPAL